MASIRKYKNKNSKKYMYEYRIKYTDPVTGKVKEKSKRGFASKKEAELAAAEVEKKLFVGDVDIVKNSDITVKDWIEQYLELYGSQLRETTLKTRKTRLYNHIIPELGNYKLQKLTRMQYQKFINKKLDAMKESTVKSLHGTFMTIVNKAVEHGIIDRNKFQGISISKGNEEEKIKFLTKEEVEKLLMVAKTFEFDEYMSVFILLRTGLRKGELLALTWDDIDFDNKLMTINKNRNHLGTFPPKTKKSNRVISMDNKLTKELKRFQLWQAKNKLQFGRYQFNNYVLVDRYGVPYHEWKINAILENMAEKANLSPISPHALRHTHAVMLLESGVDIKTVSDRLGHTKINMTADVYLHVSRKQEDEAVLKLEKYLDSSFGG
ncbi:site-specific integrase [Parageobacillus toebii]|uniref:tyrosine-type recombinase/integrase n=1 Tax=Parageobacillus toebii TaxID=153151 RepID=UPI00296F231E|nr:site-specific integrase [Parageobacillus toebii]MED4990107.1 site-specific integrase [Parageobacillus toebii]